MRLEVRLFIIAAVLILVGVAILSSAASAATPMQVANDAWPASPCYDQPITILWDHDMAAAYGFTGNASGITELADGTWDTERCEITLDPAAVAGMNAAERCELLVHETGHLAGMQHTPEGSGVMGPHGGWWPACHTLRERIKHDVARLVPDPDPFVACTGWRGAVMRCRAEWSHGTRGLASVARFRVRRSGETYTIRRVDKQLRKRSR